jgi:murein DD-endopeptidase MepM/ murein hydrolase activator NlpD
VVRPFQPPPAPWLAGHRGVDLSGSAGSPVLAAGDGVVAFAGWVAGVPAVSVDHPGGLRTTYEPVVATVRRGADVRRGEVLGTLASAPSHCAPAACLHWGLRRGDSYLDPLSLLGVDLRVRLLPVWDP